MILDCNVAVSQYTIQFPQLLDSAIRYAGGDTSHVFIVSIPDYAYTPYGQSTGNQTISQEIDDYNVINKYFADSFNIKYFDITPISRLGIAQPNLVASDGLHPSAIQYSEWVKLMLQYIDGNLTTFIKENNSKNNLLIYPNPANEIITLFDSENNRGTVELYNNIGQLVFKQEVNSNQTDVSLKNLSKGIYIIRVLLENKQIVKKIIKD